MNNKIIQDFSLDPHQIKAVESVGRTLCLSGAGSGKTRTLCAKAAYEISRGKAVIIVTFTVSAAEEIKERLDLILAHVGTLHSYCLKVMRSAGLMRELVDESTLNELIKETIDRLRLRKLSLKQAHWIVVSRQPDNHDGKLLLGTIDRIMEEGHLITYDGILELGAELIKEQDYENVTVLVDEFQDSSSLDIGVYNSFLSHKNLEMWLVGDLQQAIYGFRHSADVRLDLPLWASARRFAICTLPLNYRCSQKVVKTANILNEIFTGRVESISTGPEGSVAIARSETEGGMLERIITAVKTDDPDEIAVLCRTWKECAAVVAVLEANNIKVRTRKENGLTDQIPPLLWAALTMFKRPTDWLIKRYAVLRYGKVLADKLEADSRHTGRPISGISWNYERAKPKDFLAVVDLLAIPKDQQAWMHRKLSAAGDVSSWEDFTLALFEGTKIEEIGEGVTVTTVHSAKGREWRHVIVPYCDTQSYRPRDGEEGERVLFVAVTRAKLTVLLLYSGTRTEPVFGRTVKVEPCAGLQRLLEVAKPR